VTTPFLRGFNKARLVRKGVKRFRLVWKAHRTDDCRGRPERVGNGINPHTLIIKGTGTLPGPSIDQESEPYLEEGESRGGQAAGSVLTLVVKNETIWGDSRRPK